MVNTGLVMVNDGLRKVNSSWQFMIDNDEYWLTYGNPVV